MLKGLSFIVLSYLLQSQVAAHFEIFITLHKTGCTTAKISCTTAKITNELVSLLTVRTIFAQNITP